MAPLGTVSSRAAARRSSRSASYGSLGPISEPGPPPGEVRVLPPATPLDRLRQEVLTAVNAERTARGLAALTLEETLSGVAQKHAEDMDRRRYLSHTSPEGKGVEDRLRAVQYFTPPCNCVVRFAYGENIAKGQQTTADVVKAWMASPLHKENILKKDFKAMGLGFIRGIWVQVFGAVHVEK